MTSHVARIPPLQLAAMTFAIAAAATALKWLARAENPVAYLRQGPAAWLVGVGGLFGYHAFYFAAIRSAPVIDVSLIAYLRKSPSSPISASAAAMATR